MHFTSRGGPEVDIPEWSGETVHGQAFGIDAISNRAYSSLTTDEAMTNPSSYAALAQQISLGADERFGAARPHE